MPATARNKNNKYIQRGTLFVLSAPSGAGKSTLCRKLLEKIPELKLSVSFTTREPRRGERNDVHYSFISERKFKGMINRDEFAEWAMVHGNLYGTSLKRLKKLNKEGYDIILDIDIHGAMQIKKSYENAVFVFILPPSRKDLNKRLRARNTDSREVIAGRLDNAKEEMSFYMDYDYIVINDDLETAYRQIESIIVSTKLEIKNIDHKRIKHIIG
jgi:guanylate kinase